jgi:hypothetical protein
LPAKSLLLLLLLLLLLKIRNLNLSLLLLLLLLLLQIMNRMSCWLLHRSRSVHLPTSGTGITKGALRTSISGMKIR